MEDGLWNQGDSFPIYVPSTVKHLVSDKFEPYRGRRVTPELRKVLEAIAMVVCLEAGLL